MAFRSGSRFILLGACFGVAIPLYRLYALDVSIRRTLLYGTLTAVPAAIYAAGVVGARALLGTIAGPAGGHQPVFIVATTLLIAALFNPLRRGLQRAIDRRFSRRRYDAARTLDAFGAKLHTETGEGDRHASRPPAYVNQTLRRGKIAPCDALVSPGHRSKVSRHMLVDGRTLVWPA